MKDVKGYIERLDHSMNKDEKLFFMKHIDVSKFDFIIDFGGANGHLLHEIDKELPTNSETVLICVENNNQIKTEYEFEHQFVRVSSLHELNKHKLRGKEVLMIFSSVLHEIDWDTWYELRYFVDNYASYVVVRDMYFLLYDGGMAEMLNLIRTFPVDLWGSFVNASREESLTRNVYEFLLKYTYTDNWETEKVENYFARTTQQFVAYLLGNHDTIYQRNYILPFKKQQVKDDFGYTMTSCTHIQLISKINKGE